MNAFLLACYICLQLTNLSDLNQHAILKRDNACDQCLTGVFDHSELMSPMGAEQSSGNLLSSNPALKEALEERLMSELSRTSLKSKLQQKKEPMNEVALDKQADRASVIVEDTLKATEEALKIMEEIVVSNIKKASEEMMSQLKEQQVQASREYELLANKQRELLVQKIAAAQEPVKKAEEKPPVKNRNILKNNVRLMAGESLISENGRYKATMQQNGELVITDKYQQGNVVKKIGHPKGISGKNFHLLMQQDGNLVIYYELHQGNSYYPTWYTGTDVRDGRDHYLKLENNGQLVMYNGVGRQIWTSGQERGREYNNYYFC